MKLILGLCALAVFATGGLIWNSMRMPSHYGEFTGVPQAKVADLVDRPVDYLKKTVTVEGTVQEQCTSMGCYFYLHSGRKTLRVDIQEVAMKAPERNGHNVRVEGQMVPYGDGYQLYASAVEFK